MLAQNFKGADDLKLTDAEHRSLITVLGMLERGEIEHRSASQAWYSGHAGFVPTSFNMRFFAGSDECGTVACICGWAEFVGGLEHDVLLRKRLKNQPLCDLFDPSGFLKADTIGATHAAAALRNYLTHGEPRWREVMGGV